MLRLRGVAYTKYNTYILPNILNAHITSITMLKTKYEQYMMHVPIVYKINRIRRYKLSYDKVTLRS